MPALRQLSFEVDRHPRLPDDGWLTGTLGLKGTFHMPQNLQPGDELVVVVQDADGVVIATSGAEVENISFKPIKDHGQVIGTERVHKAALKL